MRIFLAESDPELRVGLQFLINQQSSFKVIGITDNGKRLKKQIKASRPDVLLLDWYLPGKPMNELIADLREFDLGAWEGRSFRDLRDNEDLWGRWAADPCFAQSSGKSLDLMSTMARQF